MTSQTIIVKESVLDITPSSDTSRLFETVKSLYKSDHQAEYLDINAQIELLLQQLQTEIQHMTSTAE